MKQKKKLIVLLLSLIILILLANIIISKNTNTYKISYKDNTFTVKQIHKNSYIEISDKTNIYPVEVNGINKKRLIDKVYYFSNNTYKCLLPIIDNKVYVDMMCYYEDIIYNYHDIKGKDKELDKFVLGIEEYDINKFLNSENDYKTINTVKIYNDTKKSVAITSYKGLILNNKEIELFNNDVYNNKLSTFLYPYYIVADYNQKYEFEYFYAVNLNNSEVIKIKSKNTISLDSYIQGIVDNKVYLYDKDNENQYEIDINKKQVKLISNKDKVKYYKNNKWEQITKVTANKEKYFDYTTLDNNFTDFDECIETTNKFYLIKNRGANNDIYEVNKNNLKLIKYILTTPTTDIEFNDDILYYSYKTKLYYYSNLSGLTTLLDDSELQFNNSIKYYVY